MPVNWSTLISDHTGTVDYGRVKSLLSVILAALAGVVMIAAASLEAWTRVDIPTTHILIIGGALVLPITGGVVGHMFGAALGKAQAKAQAESESENKPIG